MREFSSVCTFVVVVMHGTLRRLRLVVLCHATWHGREQGATADASRTSGLRRPIGVRGFRVDLLSGVIEAEDVDVPLNATMRSLVGRKMRAWRFSNAHRREII